MKLKKQLFKKWLLILFSWAMIYFFFAAVYRVYKQPSKQELETFKQQRKSIGQ